MIRSLGAWTYRRDQKLGRGGYADVFACQAVGAREDSVEGALKVFKDPTYANTLEREVSALESLRGCPNTPQLLDYGRDGDGRLCIVTSRALGEPMEGRLRKKGAVAESLVAEIVQQMLQTLAFAHVRGWLHKDLKASNLLVTQGGVTLLDWGIAEPLGEGRTHAIRSRNQDAVAPECYYGRHGVASDFYQLGLLAWHLLAGVMPYHLATEVRRDYRVAAHCLERPVLPEQLDPRLRALLVSWLDKDPERRLIGYDLNQLLDRVGVGREPSPGAREFLAISIDGYMNASARAGVPHAMHELGMRAEDRGDRIAALEWLEKAAECGFAASQCELAEILEHSAATADSAQRIMRLLRDAADSGMPRAQYKLAQRLRRIGGDGDELRSWLLAAARGGVAQAQYRLGRDLEQDKVDPATIVDWFGRAADRGYGKARLRLASYLERGRGIERNLEAARFWRMRAAEGKGSRHAT